MGRRPEGARAGIDGVCDSSSCRASIFEKMRTAGRSRKQGAFRRELVMLRVLPNGRGEDRALLHCRAT